MVRSTKELLMFMFTNTLFRKRFVPGCLKLKYFCLCFKELRLFVALILYGVETTIMIFMFVMYCIFVGKPFIILKF